MLASGLGITLTLFFINSWFMGNILKKVVGIQITESQNHKIN